MKPHHETDKAHAMFCCGMVVWPMVMSHNEKEWLVIARWSCPGCGETMVAEVGKINPEKATECQSTE